MIDEGADTVAAEPEGGLPRRRAPRKRSSRAGRRLVRGLAIAGVALLAVTARVVVGSALELGRGDAALEAGDAEGARMHFRRAAAWYAPANPYVSEALDRLEGMAGEAEAAGSIDEAVLAWRAVRSAILGARGLYTPHRPRLERANAKIASLMLQQEQAPMDLEASDDELRREYQALLRDVPGPRVGWALLALAGFVLWVGAAFRMSRRAFDGEDRFLRGPGWRHLGAIALGLVLFATGLAFA